MLYLLLMIFISVEYETILVKYFVNKIPSLQEILDFPTKLSEEISYELATKYSSESICQSKWDPYTQKSGVWQHVIG